MTDTIVGPAHWHDYLIHGDASDLEPGEAAIADAWLAHEGVRVTAVVPYADPWFSWSARIHVPELDCEGCAMYDYYCINLKAETNMQKVFKSFTEIIAYFNLIGWNVTRNRCINADGNIVGIITNNLHNFTIDYRKAE